MSGIFPDSGVTPSQALNSILNPDVAEGCLPLFYSSTRCNPRFDPAAANALMSEFLNVINGAGSEYDCSKLDNLLRAIKALAFNPGAIFTFSTPGPQSIIVPENKSYAEIELVGGGGGGGSIAAVAQAAAGGNGGDLIRDTILVVPNTTINFTVGSGGLTQASPATALNGGDSTLGGLIAKGGRGAPAFATSGGAASPGSVGSVGAYLITGQIGEYGMVLGGGAGDRIGGRGGSSGQGTQGGNGAFNGGTGGNPGQQPGGGGGGASGGSGFSAGGGGANGRVTITFF